MLFDSIAALGLMIAFYYGLTGFACTWYYRRTLTSSLRRFLLVGVAPFTGGAMLLFVFVRSCIDLGRADAGSTTLFGLGSPLVIGLGFLLLGVVLMGIWRVAGHRGVLPPPSRGRGARGRRAVPARRRGGGAGARMNIGIPTEIKPDERRVALTPAGAREFARRGHRVLVQRGAGAGSGFSDDAYRAAGAELADDVFADAELILKVKEPQPQEVERLSRAAHAVHLPAPRRRPAAGVRAGRERRALHRLRDGRGRAPGACRSCAR